jgi:alkanesulfonate monooxygenase SsuD/methylene tetrahydromethanopterin reductase-like flavin-dependent oxidoreductase (luciferase family)
MDLGVHLPLADLGQGIPGGAELRAFTAQAAELGFAILSANDHLVWRRPWLAAPTTLASVPGRAGGMTLATSVALPAVRHPVVLAKAIASLAVLADGPVIAGLGPGSSADDFRAVGVPFGERWARFDEGLRLVRALLRGEPTTGAHYYPADGLRLDPLPAEPPQVWFGSWGSDVRLRRMAAAADGWLASAYNTTPERFADARARLDGHLLAAGKDPAAFPDAVATAWMYVTHEAGEAADVLENVLAPLLGRDPAGLAAQLPVGSPEHCIELLLAYARAGAGRILVWPVRDPRRQLEVFAEEVRPFLPGRPLTPPQPPAVRRDRAPAAGTAVPRPPAG